MDKLQNHLDEYKELEDDYDCLQRIIENHEEPTMILCNGKAYYITHCKEDFLKLLLKERETITRRLVSLKQSMSKELSKPENKQLKLI